MVDAKSTECDFDLKGLKFNYNKNFKAFLCDQKDVLAILRHNCPSSYEKILVKYPELQPAEPEYEQKLGNGYAKIEGWKEPVIKETKEVAAQVKDGKDEEEMKMAGAKKPGMISRFSKGIKKMIARITPTKLRKKWHLEEEEAVSQNGENQ